VANLLRLLAARNALYLGASFFVMAGFQFIMCAVVGTMNISGAFEELVKTMPPLIQTMLSEQLLGGVTSRGLLAFGWNHPITQALGTAMAIVLASRAVAGEIEHGPIELLLSQPISRAEYLTAQTFFGLLSLGALTACGALGTAIGQWSFELKILGAMDVLRLGSNYFALQSAWLGITMLFSVVGREGGRVGGTVFLIAIVSYIVQVVGTLWNGAAFLLPISLHHYYTPQSIVTGEGFSLSLGILGGITLLTLGISLRQFRRRDVP
jgi:ABC-type transport system involved in multi-copper enzyme maturation permease subunit